ncbi:hypothetical protein [Bordetella genomosp. 11]|uniref:hypothetical protein n=1 Tax=Bordetella genomosp. 11 TaxID=1416808 RepID=UPI0015953371|nr:hypothetical protein [Bordetella genomosp. 11]
MGGPQKNNQKYGWAQTRAIRPARPMAIYGAYLFAYLENAAWMPRPLRQEYRGTIRLTAGVTVFGIVVAVFDAWF